MQVRLNKIAAQIRAAIGASIVLSSLALSPAHAAGVVGGIVVGGGITVATGAVSGSAASQSQGSSIAGSEVIGTGNSMQHTDSTTIGYATIGGTVNYQGAGVATNVVNSSTVNSSGNVSGDAPLSAADGSIINGTTGFASTTGSAIGGATYQKVGISGVAGIGGTAGFTSF